MKQVDAGTSKVANVMAFSITCFWCGGHCLGYFGGLGTSKGFTRRTFSEPDTRSHIRCNKCKCGVFHVAVRHSYRQRSEDTGKQASITDCCWTPSVSPPYYRACENQLFMCNEAQEMTKLIKASDSYSLSLSLSEMSLPDSGIDLGVQSAGFQQLRRAQLKG